MTESEIEFNLDINQVFSVIQEESDKILSNNESVHGERLIEKKINELKLTNTSREERKYIDELSLQNIENFEKPKIWNRHRNMPKITEITQIYHYYDGDDILILSNPNTTIILPDPSGYINCRIIVWNQENDIKNSFRSLKKYIDVSLIEHAESDETRDGVSFMEIIPGARDNSESVIMMIRDMKYHIISDGEKWNFVGIKLPHMT